jgi:hypothetical protein
LAAGEHVRSDSVQRHGDGSRRVRGEDVVSAIERFQSAVRAVQVRRAEVGS